MKYLCLLAVIMLVTGCDIEIKNYDGIQLALGRSYYATSLAEKKKTSLEAEKVALDQQKEVYAKNPPTEERSKEFKQTCDAFAKKYSGYENSYTKAQSEFNAYLDGIKLDAKDFEIDQPKEKYEASAAKPALDEFIASAQLTASDETDYWYKEAEKIVKLAYEIVEKKLEKAKEDKLKIFNEEIDKYRMKPWADLQVKQK